MSLPLDAERSLVDCLAPSAITNVTSDGRKVKVSLRVEADGSPEGVRVAVSRDLTDEWRAPEVTWSGVARSDVEYAEAMANTLRQAAAVARVLTRVIESPNGPVLDMDERQANPGGWQQIQRGLIWHMADYALCVWMLVHGGQPYYDRAFQEMPVEERNPRLDAHMQSLDALREEAFLIATGIEVT